MNCILSYFIGNLFGTMYPSAAVITLLCILNEILMLSSSFFASAATFSLNDSLVQIV